MDTQSPLVGKPNNGIGNPQHVGKSENCVATLSERKQLFPGIDTINVHKDPIPIKNISKTQVAESKQRAKNVHFRGLKNGANVCFIASALQNLMHGL